MNVAWLNPAALAGLAAIAAPILVHLLRRHRAQRLPFPTLQFVTPSRAAAIRAHAPTDLGLLLLRIAIIAAAATAWAQPIVMGGLRRMSDDGRVVRAIVVDTSGSMAVARERAREAVLAEQQGAANVFELSGEDVAASIASAVEWLETAGPARREIVVVSDLAHGSVQSGMIARIPEPIGVRFVRIARGATASRFDGMTGLGAAGVTASVQKIAVDGASTAVSIAPSGEASNGPRILTVAPKEPFEAMLRAVATAGTPSLPRGRPLAIAFGAAPLPEPLSPPRDGWMLQAIVAARDHAGLREAAAAAGAAEGRTAEQLPWVAVARSGTGTPVVSVAAFGPELLAHVAAEPSAFLAAAATRALLFAASGRLVWPELETETISSEQLNRWTRAPGPGSSGALPTSAPGDARVIWMAVLALIAIETIVRRRTESTAPAEESRRAA